MTDCTPDNRPLKTVDSTMAEAMHIVMYGDANGEGRLFGGRLMEWIDEVAGIAACRHVGGSVTTACVDSLQFKHPAFLNDVLVLQARITYVGNKSLEVRVDSFAEHLETGERTLINTAYLVEVHVNHDGRPQPIRFGLDCHSPEAEAEWHAARLRAAIRRTRQADGF